MSASRGLWLACLPSFQNKRVILLNKQQCVSCMHTKWVDNMLPIYLSSELTLVIIKQNVLGLPGSYKSTSSYHLFSIGWLALYCRLVDKRHISEVLQGSCRPSSSEGPYDNLAAPTRTGPNPRKPVSLCWSYVRVFVTSWGRTHSDYTLCVYMYS